MNGKRRSRQVLLTAGLLALLAILSVAGALQQNDPEAATPLDSGSTAPTGAAALVLWLEAMGYAVSTGTGDSFAPPSEARLAFLLEPYDFTETDLDLLLRWVEDGGTLIFAGERLASNPVLSRFNVARRAGAAPAAGLTSGVPLLTEPPIPGAVMLDAASYLEPAFPDFVPLFAGPAGPVVLAFDRGAGRVIMSAETFPFTNAGLKTEGSPEFVLNLIGTAPRGSLVWFDEWHHGQRPSARVASGPGAWLRETSAGRAVLFSAAALFAWIALSGRAFGPPVRPHAESIRRAPHEYITAIASLNQRADNRAFLLETYHRQLKRGFGRRYRLDPRLPDSEFLDRLRAQDRSSEAEALGKLLSRLRARFVSPGELVELAAEAARWLERAEAGGGSTLR